MAPQQGKRDWKTSIRKGPGGRQVAWTYFPSPKEDVYELEGTNDGRERGCG